MLSGRLGWFCLIGEVGAVWQVRLLLSVKLDCCCVVG